MFIIRLSSYIVFHKEVEMLLSIGMFVKNEEKFLRDCLTALTPILESVESELIIYDTGSTDATVEIAREFTDKVFCLEWRGDFSWARNHTLQKAKGRWYMYVDADEIFEDTADIVEFFALGMLKRFNTAFIKRVNIMQNSATSSSYLARIVKMKKESGLSVKSTSSFHTKNPASTWRAPLPIMATNSNRKRRKLPSANATCHRSLKSWKQLSTRGARDGISPTST